MSDNEKELMPEGRYQARAHSWDFGETNGGAPQIAVSFKLLEPGFEGQFLGWYGGFGDTQAEFTFKALKNCGWRGIDLNDLSGMGDNEVSLVVEHEEYQGKTHARVKWVNAGGGVMLKKVLDPNAKKALAAKMKATFAAFEVERAAPKAANTTTKKAAPAASRRPEPPPHGDDDMPF